MESLIQTLQKTLSPDSVILTSNNPDFASSIERWTNIDRKVPGAVVQPASEHDIAKTIEKAVQANIPFVPATGGHSTWSTTGKEGIVIDLSRYKYARVNPSEHTVAVGGGLLTKELQKALNEKHEFTTVANGNTVGVIPYIIGGGISSYTPLIGYGCENLLAAKMVSASGKVIEMSETHNLDLLWGIRGAGQFLGLVTEITLRTYPLSLIGPKGVRQIGTIFYPVDRALEACRALAKVTSGKDHASAGHFMVMKDPSGKDRRVLMVAPQYFGTGPELQATFKPLIDLDPLSHQHMDSTFLTHSDHLDWMLPKGEFKRFSQTGMKSINPENFVKLVNLHQNLLDTVPGTERSVFTLEWHTPTPGTGAREIRTAFGHKEVDIWLNILTWYTDPAYHEKVLEFDQKAQELMRADSVPEAYIAYTNTSRNDPIEYRYKGKERVAKLKSLKQEWDREGRFTKELL